MYSIHTQTYIISPPVAHFTYSFVEREISGYTILPAIKSLILAHYKLDWNKHMNSLSLWDSTVNILLLWTILYNCHNSDSYIITFILNLDLTNTFFSLL